MPGSRTRRKKKRQLQRSRQGAWGSGLRRGRVGRAAAGGLAPSPPLKTRPPTKRPSIIESFLSAPKPQPTNNHEHHYPQQQAPSRSGRPSRGRRRRRVLLDLPRGPVALGRPPRVVLRLPARGAQGPPPVPADVHHLQGRHRVAYDIVLRVGGRWGLHARAGGRGGGPSPEGTTPPPLSLAPSCVSPPLLAPARPDAHPDPKAPMPRAPNVIHPPRARAAFGGLWVRPSRARFRRRGVGGHERAARRGPAEFLAALSAAPPI